MIILKRSRNTDFSVGQLAGLPDVGEILAATRERLNIRRTPPMQASLEDQKRVLVDNVLLVSLRPVFLGVTFVIFGSTIFRMYEAPFRTSLAALVIGLVVGGTFLVTRGLMIQGRIPGHWAHPLAAMLSLIGYFFVLYNLIFRQDQFTELRFVGISLLIIITGALFLHLRWLLGMMTFILVSWTAVNLALDLNIGWRVYLILYPIIAVSSLANFAARKQAISQMIDAQMKNDLQNAQLAEALERAHRSEAQLKAERDLAGQVVDSMGQGLVLLDNQGVIEFVNPAAVEILGTARDALVGRSIAEILTSDTDDLAAHIAGRSDDPDHSIDTFVDHGDGRISHILASMTFRDSGGIILNLMDLTFRKAFESRLEQLAHYDALTGLANRSLLNERISQAIRPIERRLSRIAVLFIDLDRFKPINDTMGHAVGDQVLVETGNRIQECVRAGDTVARIGGDEFVVLLTNLENVDATLEIADRIAERIEEPVVLDGQTLKVAASIGVVINRTSAANAEDLMHYADTAMYEAKRRPNLRRVLYTPEMRARFSRLPS